MRKTTTFMAVVCIMLLSMVLGGTLSSFADSPVTLYNDNHYGAESNPTGNPIGGGQGYNKAVSVPPVVVATAADLVYAVNSAASGSVIYVDDNANIDMSSSPPLVLPSGVTLASGRGSLLPDATVSQGGRLYLNKPGATMIQVNGTNVRITGLRIDGMDNEEGTSTYGIPVTTGVQILPTYAPEIDNNELMGWTYAAVLGSNGHVHHNDIHHNRRTGLGYGVVITGNAATTHVGVLIEANKFDWNRHSIAATGNVNDRYEARYNYIGGNMVQPGFDMHDFPACNCGGDIVHVHHNTFEIIHNSFNEMSYALDVGNAPKTGLYVYNNWMYNPNPEYGLRLAKQMTEAIQVGMNKFGTGTNITYSSMYLFKGINNSFFNGGYIFSTLAGTPTMTAGRTLTVGGIDNVFNAEQVGDQITYTINVAASKTFSVQMFKGPGLIPESGAIVKVYFDGDSSHPAGIFDTSLTPFSNASIGQQTLDAGTHTVTLEVIGKNPNSLDFKVYYRMLRLNEDIGFWLQADKQLLTVGESATVHSIRDLSGASFASEDPSIATVTPLGLITRVSAGTTNVVASVYGDRGIRSSAVQITVVDITP
ncbi:hypothetical protein ACFFNY_31595 [Paenibacillus hodogayensis]|uniref:BIG2 domain-containing protein n=1 Tax=Paenibacillus hodogayensis TaxID=279208 RepID=A0ABV5W6D8_9BACL